MTEHQQASISPEQRLFLGVIVNAVFEGIGKTHGTKSERKRAQVEARRWFTRTNEDFREVCLFAGLHPDDVQRGALSFFSAHDRDDVGLRRIQERNHRKQDYRYGVSQYDIADHAEVSQQTVSRVLAGETNPHTPKAQRVFAAVKVLTGIDLCARAA